MTRPNDFELSNEYQSCVLNKRRPMWSPTVVGSYRLFSLVLLFVSDLLKKLLKILRRFMIVLNRGVSVLTRRNGCSI